MSKRNALLVAIAAAVVLAVFFLWPEPARADLAASARVGGFAGHDLGGRLHGGGARGRIHLGDGGVRGRVHFGAGDIRRHRSSGHRHGHAHGHRHGHGRDAHRSERRHRLDDDFLGSEHTAGRPGVRFRHRDLDGDWRDRRRYGHDRRGKGHGHWRGKHRWERHGRAPLLPYGAEVIVREEVVPVLVPVPAERPADRAEPALDPRGRAVLVGEEGGIGQWSEGDVLPREVPHVTLDPAAYDLPQPPLGEKYARVGNEVLRIDIGSRRITEVVAR